jgi:hypothetical protein
MAKNTLTLKRLAVNKWGYSSYRVEGAAVGGTVRFSKNAFAGDPPETVEIVAEGLQAGPVKAAKAPKEPKAAKAPKEPKAKKAKGGAAAEGATVEGTVESAATTEPPAPIEQPEPVAL